MITGLDQLDALEARLRSLADAPELAAQLAAPALLSVARAEYAAGADPDGTAWDPLKVGSGAPLRELTAGAEASASGRKVVVVTPEPTKYHQGGYFIHHGGGARLREAQAAVRTAKANADVDGLKASRKRVREVKKQIRTEGTRVATRRTLPGRRSIPVAWARALGDTWRAACERLLGGVS